MAEEKIKRGQALLTMKIKAEKHLHLRDPDLMKIPLEALHKVALQQIGEQEAYIEELEETVKKLQRKLEQKEEKFALTKEENRRIAEARGSERQNLATLRGITAEQRQAQEEMQRVVYRTMHADDGNPPVEGKDPGT